MLSKNRSLNATKALTYCSLLAAISVILARFLVITPNESTRFSIEAVPIFLSGLLFGMAPGAMVGFAADFVGCMFSPFGYNPIFCIPPILYGLFGGIFRRYISAKPNPLRLLLGFLPPVALGSLLYQSATLAFLYYDGLFVQGFLFYLTTRSIQFSVTLVLDVLILYLLLRSGIFQRLHLWPLSQKKAAKIHTAEDAIRYIHSVCWKGSVPGLERTFALLEKMGNPQNDLKYVHIAGTNGKGSTAAMTASILQEAGYRTGLYTSPYIYRFHERMQVNGQPITDAELIAITEYVRPLADSMTDSPTEFELVCCIAFEYFRRQNCDIVVLEVGMGGALDATNVIPTPEVAVITNIGLDHTEFLGDTVEKIAETKCGIFKPGGHAVLYPSGAGVEAVCRQICAERNLSLKEADFHSLTLTSHSLEGQIFSCGQRADLFLPLLGDHQLHNAAVVLSTVDTLIENGWHITEDHIRQGLARVCWPGRFDIISRDPLFIIDGGHNPQCIEALVKNIQDYLANKRLVVLTGVLADKDYEAMYRPVLPYAAQFVCITPPNPRKLDAAALAEYLTGLGAKATAADSIPQGVQLAKSLAGSDGVVLCFGSLYSIGSIRDAL